MKNIVYLLFEVFLGLGLLGLITYIIGIQKIGTHPDYHPEWILTYWVYFILHQFWVSLVAALIYAAIFFQTHGSGYGGFKALYILVCSAILYVIFHNDAQQTLKVTGVSLLLAYVLSGLTIAVIQEKIWDNKLDE